MNSPDLFDPLGGAFLHKRRDPGDLRERHQSRGRTKRAETTTVALSLALLMALFAVIVGQHETETARSVTVAFLTR